MLNEKQGGQEGNSELNGTLQRGNGFDLEAPGTLIKLAKRIKEDIDAWCVKTYDDGPRSHLGASIIGHPCARYSWFTFRWIHHKKFTGRMYRLFDRGKREEARFCEYLRGIGFTIWEFQENGEQHRISMASGHGGGSLDAIARCPHDYNIGLPLLTEFKTNGTGRGFNDLMSQGLALAKPRHFAQMSIYGSKYKIQYGLYMNANKNDDDIYIEIPKLNWTLAQELEAKTCEIVSSQEPPSRLAESAAYHECKYCDYVDHCHNQRMPDKNCRSCINAIPIENAEWKCNLYDLVIPKTAIKLGCYVWRPII